MIAEAFMEEVEFTCPQCGKVWYEMQSPEDDWFKLATNSVFCNECSKEIMTDLKEKWANENLLGGSSDN